MKKVILVFLNIFLGFNVFSQSECFFLNIEREVFVPKDERIIFRNDLKFLYSEYVEYDNGITVASHYFEEFVDRFNPSICPQYVGKEFTGYWFSVQDNRVVYRANGNSIWFTPTSMNDISTCLSIFIRDENYNVIGVENISCVRSSFNGKHWETIDINFNEVVINEGEKIYDYNYTD